MLREFFEANMIVVLFGYGLVFFLLGFAITMQSRLGSRLTLARSLPLLGTFGILHGIAEWGHVFIPIQSLYLHEGVIAVLQGLATTLLSLAFVALFSFGARLVYDMTGRYQWLTWLPLCLFFAWLLAFLVVGTGTGIGNYQWWLAAGDLWSRYLLAFTGALLTCYALTLQAEEFREQGLTKLLPNLRLAVLSFALYAVAGGLLVPASGFFPANVINADTFFHMTGLPVQIPRAIAGLFMAYSIVRILEIFDIEHARRLEEAERTRAVLEERDRIARELHDGIIQSLYAVGLNLENARYLIDEHPEEAKNQIATVMKSLNRSIQDIRHTIMDLKVAPERRSSLTERLRALAEELGTSYHRSIVFETDVVEAPRFDDGDLHHLSQIVREAVTNAVRHGRAQHITISLRWDESAPSPSARAGGGGLVLSIKDNGEGFDPEAIKPEAGFGNGLANMEHRARRLGGHLDIVSRPGEGTIVSLRLPARPAAEGRSRPAALTGLEAGHKL